MSQVCEKSLAEVLEIIDRLVELESPSDSIAEVSQLSKYIRGYLEGHDVYCEQVEFSPRAPGLTADVGHGEEQFLFLCHIDTVWPLGETKRRPLKRNGDRLEGVGVADMKGGVALVMWLFANIVPQHLPPGRRLRALFTTDEEVGSQASKDRILMEAARSAAVFVFEPGYPDGSVKTARKGWGHFSASAYGRAAHAGSDHQDGRSAIRAIARVVEEVEALTNYEQGVTLNVGTIVGGRQRNSIPDFAEIEIDLRAPTTALIETYAKRLRQLSGSYSGVRVEVDGEINRYPFERTLAVEQIYKEVNRLSKLDNVELGEVSMGGVSDGNYSAALGIPTIDGLGPAGAGTHAIDEYILVSSLLPRLRLLERICYEAVIVGVDE